ncbi:MAG: hypothetical protein RL204_1495 [Bacteroidota bacterium]|jgi:hypothetical protein
MTSITEIIEFVKEKTGHAIVAEDTDIENDLGCTGGDFHELIEVYSKRFNVDMSGYLWYFHCTDEGLPGIGEGLFKPPHSRVNRIPITPKMLFEFAEIGKWNLQYPKHKIPKRRYDSIINLIVLIIALLLIIWYYISA